MKKHPSGRPVRSAMRPRPAFERFGESGFRLDRLNPGHIRQATDTFAIGFVDDRIGFEDEFEGRRRR